MNVTGCTILDCDHAGLLLKDVTESRVSDCLISNELPDAESWGPLQVIGGGENTISLCVFSHGTEGAPLAWDGVGTLSTTQTVVFGNAGGDSLQGAHTDNRFEHPLYCDPWSSVYTYCTNSPCLGTNNSWGVDVGAYGDGACGQCSSPVEQSTWGVIKTLYR